eukprot:Nitzschia sp. Nitz4//scaffold249_size28687//2274//5772//NITZ4_008114-RA/size28687-snap-gene-0.0-mRNA-1//1//CDS//3329544008//2481//frame0
MGGACIASESSVSSADSDIVKITQSLHNGTSSSFKKPGSISSTEHSSQEPIVSTSETRMVRYMKMLVFVLILFVAACGIAATYKFVDHEEEESIAKQFELEAKEVLDVSSLNALHVFQLFEVEALLITHRALVTGQEWPFVSIPYYASDVALLGNKTNVNQLISLSPLVTEDQREAWEAYSTSNETSWLVELYEFHGLEGEPHEICSSISMKLGDCIQELRQADPYYAPVWQVEPVSGPNEEIINYNSFDSDYFKREFDHMVANNEATLSEVINFAENDDGTNTWSGFSTEWPESLLLTPVHASSDVDSPVVAVLTGVVPWHIFFENILPESADGLVVVVRGATDTFTFELDGPSVSYVGYGDLHDAKYDHLEMCNDFGATEHGQADYGFDICAYPNDDFCSTNHAVVYTVVVALVFFLTASSFLLYDFLVNKRQKKVEKAAKDTTALVSSLFPENVRHRVVDQAVNKKNNKLVKLESSRSLDGDHVNSRHQLVSTLGSAPIADVFSEVTIMFGDLAGFTAWASSRDPAQVFFLLEAIYDGMDRIAQKMKVFKVETIGDSYVAVAGIPEARKDHAIVMARFASRCLLEVSSVVRDVSATLGPDTADLRMRFGLHSGPVIAGVLRGTKSRFQLFGDTVNVASRMESTGAPNRIQLSQHTRDLLVGAGRSDWVKEREDLVVAKGKGELRTYWLNQTTNSASTSSSVTPCTEHPASEKSRSQFITDAKESPLFKGQDEVTRRMILWSSENLLFVLKKIVASRVFHPNAKTDVDWERLMESDQDGTMPVNEIKESVNFVGRTQGQLDLSNIVIEDEVRQQMIHFVASVAASYQDHPFHNFYHATHVTQTISKMLGRAENVAMRMEEDGNPLYSRMFTSDPLAQFALMLSALIHDLDHPGVANVTLVNEQCDLAQAYEGRSVAEQHAVCLGWELLMEPTYESLRKCIYHTDEELLLLRSIVVNAVMATDLCDKELVDLRNKRWGRAFGDDSSLSTADKELVSLKATITMECMLQGADVGHTMQHFQIYVMWNEKLFREYHKAFVNGRSQMDPTEKWYEGEMWFLDNHIIPMAKKLDACGVFGPAGNEYEQNARDNRAQWESCGRQIVQGYMERLEGSS